MAADSQIFTSHTVAVVNYPDPGKSPVLYVYLDISTAGINCVVQQFPDNGKRPVDYLAGRNFPGHLLPEDYDPPGGGFFMLH
ncbi:hypothetical protein ES707_21966 [subsurface metagenome]